jgi:ectoine hydroxylase-related dioxygenase (phytanoyl-CoA dioxygenase family)
MLTNSQLVTSRSQGFLLGGRILDDAQVETLRQELERVVRDQKRTDLPQPVLIRNLGKSDQSPVWQIVNIWEASQPFRDLAFHPTITEEVAQLTQARQLRVWHDQIQHKPAAIGGVNMWHQDSPYWRILAPKTSQMTAWIALDDADESNGCMSMVPGSHLWGTQIDFLHSLKNFDEMPPRLGEHELRAKLCPVPKGHVHYHHSLAWHGSNANTSGRPRRAIAIHYMTDETCYVATGEHPMKQFVQVADGKMLEGEHFPLVWERKPTAKTMTAAVV